MKPNFSGLSRQDLKRLLVSLKEPSYRGDQIFDWIWHKNTAEPEKMTNLSMRLRGELRSAVDWTPPAVEKKLADIDGTAKFVIGLSDGLKIESVLIPRADFNLTGLPAGAGRADCTLCVSTQVGCRMRCVFCRSGRDGLKRNLKVEEISGQLLSAMAQLAGGMKIRNIVLMGIGEPLDNLENTCGAIKIWLDIRKNAITGRRIVVSTIGIPDAIGSLSEQLGGKVSLALSLHSPFADKRKKIIRVSGVAAPEEIVKRALAFKFPRGEKLMIEYVMVSGMNDSSEDAAALTRMLKGKNCKVNLISLNPVEGIRLEPPPGEKVERFQRILIENGIMTFMRRKRGSSILAACGQLAFAHE